MQSMHQSTKRFQEHTPTPTQNVHVNERLCLTTVIY